MGGDDEGGTPPAKRTQYGIAVKTPPQGIKVPAPAPAVKVPAPATRGQTPPAGSPVQRVPVATPPSQQTRFGTGAVASQSPAPAPAVSPRTQYGAGQVSSTQPVQRVPAATPRHEANASVRRSVAQPSIQETRFGTGPLSSQRSAQQYVPTPPPQDSWGTTGTNAAEAPRDPQPPQEVVAASIGLEEGSHVRQYELIRELGRGGMGMVWAARDTKLGRRVAIKFLLDASRTVADRFLTEARATAQCNHDNIVIIYEVDQIEGMPYMVLEFLDGQPLRGLMGAYGSGTRLPASRVVELMLPVARALARAHELGIVHRDLKPENVFVTNAGQVKVLDFGIAKAVSNKEAAQPRHHYGDLGANLNLTREGALVGTLPYMSPEQMGVGEVDHRSDLWAVGIMMYEMLTGHHPIQPLTTEALITNAVEDTPMPSIRMARTAISEIPDALAALVDFCLRKRVSERIGAAAELVRQLEDLEPGRAGRQLAEGESPYPGLTAFQEGDANRFFGRSRDIQRMVSRVRELPLTGIIGPSGVGKSSFIRAGVGPALKASGEHWEVVTLRPGRQPMAALASVVQRLTTRSGTNVDQQVGDHRDLMQRLRAEPGFVGTLMRSRARTTGGHILLFVDQFEELYTLVPEPDERRAFTAALTGIADDTGAPLRVVVSMRSDFLDRIAEDQHFMEELSRGLVFLQPPDRNGLREALIAPIEMVGHRFESSAMIEDMLDALVGTQGALPLLQFAAAKLWDARDRQNRLLTVASYNAIGGISGALATHADDVIAQMVDRQQKLTQRIFRQLVTPERTRAIVELADLYQLASDRTEVVRTIDLLVDARLLVVQTRSDAGGGSVEIVHESLIERWPTLRRWLDEDQEDAAFLSQLAAAAKQWDAKKRAAGLLWRGDAMEEARRWHAQRPRELSGRDQAFLDAVFALARRGKRAKRFALVATFVVLGSGAAAASAAALWIRTAEQQAQENAAKAEHEMKVAKDALAERDKKDQERREAEKKQAAAEAAQQRISTEKDKVEVEKQKADQQVAESAEELKKKNKELEAKMLEANAAKDRAEKEREKAEAAMNETKKAKEALEAVNKKLRDEVAEMKKGGLSEKLKGM